MEKLYNNIVMSETRGEVDARNIPYLKNPPEVIDISVGRQLFTDDFLIEETDLKSEYYKAKKFDGNPILRPETPWKPTVHLRRVRKAAACGLIKKTKNLKCGMKPHGLRICATPNRMTV